MWGPWPAPQANVLRVGCSLVEHWLFDSHWLIPGVSTARDCCGFRKTTEGVGWGGSGTLLGPEGTGTRLFVVLVVFRSPLSLSRRVGGVGLGVRAGLAVIPHPWFLPCEFFVGWGSGWFGGGVGWCPFVF